MIIKDTKALTNTEDENVDGKSVKRRLSRYRNKTEKSEIRDLSESNSKLNDAENQTQDNNGEMDFGATILNADVSHLNSFLFSTS